MNSLNSFPVTLSLWHTTLTLSHFRVISIEIEGRSSLIHFHFLSFSNTRHSPLNEQKVNDYERLPLIIIGRKGEESEGMIIIYHFTLPLCLFSSSFNT